MDLVSLARDVGVVAGAIVSLGAALALIGNWLIVKPLKRYIKEVTYPISPGANGGKSLPDVAVATGEIKQSIKEMRDEFRVELRTVHARMDDHMTAHAGYPQ